MKFARSRRVGPQSLAALLLAAAPGLAHHAILAKFDERSR